ncbi:uricase [Scenedesmus sp. PABB004]|nr:uricase [Scenedesmus sp. PABB004]
MAKTQEQQGGQIAETVQWKLAGAAAWHGALFALGAAVWHAVARSCGGAPPLGAAGSTLLVYAGMAAVLVAQRRLLTTLDVPPLRVPRLGWGGKAWPSLLLARCLLRRRRLRDVADVLAFYAAVLGSAAAALALLAPRGARAPGSALATYGAALGLLHALGYLLRGCNVLSFPILQRHRYFRLKQRMRAIARSSLLLPTAALLPALAASAALRQPWAGWAAWAGLWRGGVLAAYGWAAAGACLEVVFTERVALASDDDPAPTAPLLAALAHPDPLVQDWALMDAAAVAEGGPGCGARRAAVFGDETGAGGWVPLSRYCLAELTDFVAVLAAALPSLAGAAAGGGGVKWNALQLSSAGGRAASAAADTALWHLQARCVRLGWCMRILSGLAAAALTADTYGLLQLARPGLAEVLAAQLGVVAALQAFVKHSSSIPSRPRAPRRACSRAAAATRAALSTSTPRALRCSTRRPGTRQSSTARSQPRAPRVPHAAPTSPPASTSVSRRHAMAAELKLHHHGKSKVRLGRTWREGTVHHFVEWSVSTMLESDMEAAFTDGDNTGMTATDTQKNTVYIIAKRMAKRCSIEQYGTALAQHFVTTYPRVSKARVWVEQAPWRRVEIGGIAHEHGYSMSGTEVRTTAVTYDKAGKLEVTCGVRDLRVLKTTASGYEGFLRDAATLLPETRDRIMATSVTATWKYAYQPMDYDATFAAVRGALLDGVFGPPRGGVYSPSVQYTLFQMARLALERAPQVESVFLNMPNLHFLPCAPVGSTFNDDVYIATSEPHGNIEAVVTRKDALPHCRL